MGKLPSWYKGQMQTCVICGFWYGEYDKRIMQRDGKWVCKWCNDTVTQKEAIEQSNL